MRRSLRSLLFFALLFMVMITLAQLVTSQQEAAKEIDYTTFIAKVDAGEVARVKVIEQNVEGALKDGTEFKTVIPQDPSIFTTLRAKGVLIEVALPPEPPFWTTLLSTLLPVLLVVGAFFFIMQQTQGGGSKVLQFGRSRARLHTDTKRRVTFADLQPARRA